MNELTRLKEDLQHSDGVGLANLRFMLCKRNISAITHHRLIFGGKATRKKLSEFTMKFAAILTALMAGSAVAFAPTQTTRSSVALQETQVSRNSDFFIF